MVINQELKQEIKNPILKLFITVLDLCPPPPSLIFVSPSPLFQLVRLGLEARGASAAAKEGERVQNWREGVGDQKSNTGKITNLMTLKIIKEAHTDS